MVASGPPFWGMGLGVGGRGTPCPWVSVVLVVLAPPVAKFASSDKSMTVNLS